MRWRMRDATGRPGLHPARALVLLGAIVTLLIVGLLGMHAMGGASSSHGASGSHTGIVMPATAGHMSLAHHGAADASAERCVGDCHGAAPLAPGHAELMACVLALLVGMLVLVPPGRAAPIRLPSLGMPASERASAVRLEAPPPSLTLLSISRT